jgi:hypothetical protein
MKAKIDKKTYDTDKAMTLGFKYSGEFGEPGGYEERLFITKTGQHFIYGVGGSESPYAESEIKLIDEKGAKRWLKENKQVGD